MSLYAGAVHHLYTYKVYSDVRLVFGVEYQTGFYGGDADNFTYPRYNLDVSMFRLYENDKPAETPNYLKWSPKGSADGELVFTTGPPGRHAAPEHAGAPQVPPRHGAAVLHRQQRDARGGGEEVDGAERRERAPGHDASCSASRTASSRSAAS